MRLQAEQRMDRFADDFLRRFFGNFLNVHATLGRGDDHRRAGRAVHQDGEVIFLRDIHALRDEHLVDLLAFRAGLMRHKRLAEHLPRDLLRFVGGFHEVHAAFEPILERPLAAAAGVDLRLDDDVLLAEFARDRFRFLAAAGDLARRGGNAEFLKQFFGLVFVDVHAR